jgi:hypothetical protein
LANGYVGAGLGDSHTGNSSHSPLHHVVAPVGNLDTLGKNTKGLSRALCPLSLYLSFVVWHFDPKKRWWAFGTWAVIGVVISVLAIIEKVKRNPTAEP